MTWPNLTSDEYQYYFYVNGTWEDAADDTSLYQGETEEFTRCSCQCMTTSRSPESYHANSSTDLWVSVVGTNPSG